MALDPLNKEFVRLLDKSGWTQSEAARQLDLRPSTVSQYRSGITRPSPTTLRLFKLLIGDEAPLPGGSEAVTSENPLPLDQEEKELVAEMRRLDPEDRRWLKGIVKQITERLPKKETHHRK